MHKAHQAQEKWISWVAVTSAILAVMAALTAMLAGHHANEAMIEQIQSSDRWAFYQAKSIKSSVLVAKSELLAAIGKGENDADKEKQEDYKKEMDELKKEAEEKDKASQAHLNHHVVYARGVTMFQVAIAIAAIAALVRRRRFWLVALGFGAVGAVFLIQGLMLPAIGS